MKLKTIVKFYRANGQTTDALLDQAERTINAFLLDTLPAGATVRAITPQLVHIGGAFELLVTLLIDVPTDTAAGNAAFGKRLGS